MKDSSLIKMMFALALLCGGLLFVSLIVVNYVDRSGLEDYEKLNEEIIYYSEELRVIEREIAKKSSVDRVVERSKELGYQEVQEFEYLR